MKILYVYDKMPGTYQKYLLNLLARLKDKLDVKVLVYANSAKADHSVKRYGIKDYFQYFLYKIKFSECKSIDVKYMSSYDIVHVQHSFLWRKLEYFKEINRIPKIIVTLRGGDTYVKPWLGDSWKNFYKNCEHIAAFVVMSQHQKKYLLRWGVQEEKIHVIPISFGDYSEAKPKYPNPVVLKLVSAFRMTWEKNIEGTIRFANILKEKNIPFEFDIYGDGHDLGQLYYMIARYDLQDFVHVKGKIDNDQLKEKLPDYDFFVQLSFSEAFPTSVLEAQSVGIPCVVSNSGGLPEAVIKNKTALINDFNALEELAEETITLWKNKELYYSYSKEAISNVNENFSIESELKRLTTLYQGLFEKNDVSSKMDNNY
ncbi:glycosyltransferase family 4 protein [Flavobacterium sp.]|uniref:glycosyltransferase family 4 protein n=1 Tax=Flavobacterium sp. TaxID=239 RepID=UPI002608D3D2|nr:glycosyltransferase family 4 protein [Flavobacterium sp.]